MNKLKARKLKMNLNLKSSTSCSVGEVTLDHERASLMKIPVDSDEFIACKSKS